MTAFCGMMPLATFTATQVQNEGRAFGLGDEYTDFDGKKYIFVLASGAIAANRVAMISNTNANAVAITATNAAVGSRCGVALVAFADGEYGWLQVYGPCVGIRVAASCVAGVSLYTTATAGVLDDATSTDMVAGIAINTTAGGAEATVPGILNNPYVHTAT